MVCVKDRVNNAKIKTLGKSVRTFVVFLIVVAVCVFGILWANKLERESDSSVNEEVISQWSNMFTNDYEPTKVLSSKIVSEGVRLEVALSTGEVKEFLYDGGTDKLEGLMSYSLAATIIWVVAFVILIFITPIGLVSLIFAIVAFVDLSRMNNNLSSVKEEEDNCE